MDILRREAASCKIFTLVLFAYWTWTWILELSLWWKNRKEENGTIKNSINPIKPDPFEFLISLRVCLRDTPSLTTIWNELEGWNFACRFDFTFYEDPSIQILKIDPFRVGGGVITLYKSPKCPQWGSMSSPDFYRVKITKSKLVGLLHRQNKGYMQKISILAQYLGSKSNLSVFASKLRMTKYVRIAIFQKNFKDIKKFIFLGGTK